MVFFFLVGLIFSCGEEVKSVVSKNEEPNINDTFNLPLDTAAIIEMMALPLSAHHDTLLTSHKLDTLDLIYMQYACDCQQWVDYSARYNDSDSSESNPIPVDVNVSGYFAHPADPSVAIPDDLHRAGNRFLLYGTWEERPEYKTQSLIPTYKRVLTYYGYEVIKPAKMWGPLYHTGERQIPSDPEELILRSEIYFH